MCLRKLDFEIEMAQKVRLKKSLLKQPQRFPSNDAYATQRSDVAMATVVNASLLLSVIKVMACMSRTQFPFNAPHGDAQRVKGKPSHLA